MLMLSLRCSEAQKTELFFFFLFFFYWTNQGVFGSLVCSGTWRAFMWLPVRRAGVSRGGGRTTLALWAAPQQVQNKGFRFQFRRESKWAKVRWTSEVFSNGTMYRKCACAPQRRCRSPRTLPNSFWATGVNAFSPLVLNRCYTVWQAY